jgi:hypothetical protein
MLTAKFGSIWPSCFRGLILFSDWLMLKKSSPLKQLGQMEPHLAGSIYVRSKPGIDGPWMCPFQNCVQQPHSGLSMYRSPDNRMILKQISKGVNHYLKKQQPSWMEGGAVGHNFERDTPRDHLVGWASSFYGDPKSKMAATTGHSLMPLLLHRSLCEIHAILNGGWGCWTQFWKGHTQDHLCQNWTPYIDASFQVWLHSAKLFQRRRFF